MVDRIVGYLSGPRAMLRLQVRGLHAQWQPMAFEIDTGADPMVMTSQPWFQHLGVKTEPGDVIKFADDRYAETRFGLIEVDWFGQPRLVDAIMSPSATHDAFLPPHQRGKRPNALLGRSLLQNCRLTIDYGLHLVAIEPSEGLAA